MTTPIPPKRPGLVKREKDVAEAKDRERQALRKKSLVRLGIPDIIVGPSNPEGQDRQRKEKALKRMRDALMKTGKGMYKDPEKPKIKQNLKQHKPKDYTKYGFRRPADRIAD